MLSGRSQSTVLLAVVAEAVFSPIAAAQSYPAKPVSIIVPFCAGGTTDLVACIVQPKFLEFLKLVQNESYKLGKLMQDTGSRSSR
jgi:tripartite-type tricarboxylate transporter receptor subunit TctC